MVNPRPVKGQGRSRVSCPSNPGFCKRSNSPPPQPVSEEEMVDEARSGPQNLDHRTGEDIALALLKEHLGARPLER